MAKRYQKIKGKIARIVDARTVVINLGAEQGVTASSVFFILGDPEEIIDPETKEVLGSVSVTKSRVKASQVFERFTIARTAWTETTYEGSFLGFFSTAQPQIVSKEIDEGTLKVDEKDLQPWKARTESPVKVGDEVEVSVELYSDEEDEESSVSPSADN